MNGIFNVSRRDFCRASLFGGGLVLGFSFPIRKSFGQAAPPSETSFTPNAFLRINTKGRVTVFVNKSEMGQGVYTSLPMLIAEELEVDWSEIKVEAAPVAPAYNHTQWGPVQGTGGSSSVRSEWERLRKAGAAARIMLIQAAAETWKVEPETCRAEKSYVIHPPSKKRISYGRLVTQASQMKPPENIFLKDPKDFKIIGKSMKRLDTRDKINGKAIFGIDVKVPGMLTAVVAHSPVFGGKVKSFQSEKTKAVPGVRAIVPIPSGVAVVGKDFSTAKQGREALEIEWDEGPLADLNTSAQRGQFAEMAQKPGVVAVRRGDADGVMEKAARKLEAEYEVPYLAHACMEPLNCVVDMRGESCEIWTGTQMQTGDRNAAAHILGLKPDQVKLHTTYLGGGFGRRANPASDFVSEAAQIARVIRKPIKLIWTREDDMKGGYYRPMWYDRISAGLDETGNLITWKHTIVGQSILAGTPFEGMIKDGLDMTSIEGAHDIPYAIPNLLVDLHTPKIGVPVLWWRSVGHSHNAFVVESFIDEAAQASGKDPFEFRRALLTNHPRHKAVLELAAQKAGWGTPLPAGQARGIAVHESFGSFVAQVAEVSVSPSGEIKVHRVVCAIDCGRVVNPDTVAAQMESGIVFGLTAAFYGEITFNNGRVEQSNFNNYEMLRLSEMPRAEVHILPSEEALGGVGEPGVPPIAPAVANAIFAATGKRIRRLPIRADELKKT
jgi:isoquinoline 1-oxidoreductase beta subunit